MKSILKGAQRKKDISATQKATSRTRWQND